MFEGSQHHDKGYFPAAAGRGRVAERIDQRRPHELLGSRAVQRARARAVDGIGPHGLPAAGADRGQVREPARRRAERAAAELREPAVRPGADGDAGGAVPARSSVSLDDDRRDCRSARRRRSTRCGSSSARYYHPGERVAGARGRHRSGRGAAIWRARTSRSCRRVRRSPGAARPARRSPARRGCSSKIAWSCRACTSPG